MSRQWPRFSRRRALGAAVAAATAMPAGPADARRRSASPQRRKAPKVGVALGGGGAKGLAHLVVLEAIEELGVVPTAVAGTSAGAVVGALYASGRRCAAIRKHIGDKFLEQSKSKTSVVSEVLPSGLLKVWDIIDPDIGDGGLLKGERFLNITLGDVAKNFEDLRIPLQVVATDYWNHKPVVFSQGPLKKAIEASMAIPGLLTPVKHKGNLLVDGGVINPLPFDLLQKQCDIVIAVDAFGHKTPTEGPPGPLDTLFGSYTLMQRSIIGEKLAHNPPDIYVQPDIRDVPVLAWYQAEDIYRAAAPAKAELKRQLKKLLA